MNGLLIRINGNWGHFRRPETNNNPLTHDFITKTALIGLIGAVIGVERDNMRLLFPRLCEDLLYGVRLNSVVRKESWGFTMRPIEGNMAPKHMELLKRPDFCVAMALCNDRSNQEFARFVEFIREGQSMYTPVLGLHNCPAEIRFVVEGQFEPNAGSFVTRGFTERDLIDTSKLDGPFRIGFERLPTFQNENFWNLPGRYVDVAYPDCGYELAAKGGHFIFNGGEAWTLI